MYPKNRTTKKGSGKGKELHNNAFSCTDTAQEKKRQHLAFKKGCSSTKEKGKKEDGQAESEKNREVEKTQFFSPETDLVTEKRKVIPAPKEDYFISQKRKGGEDNWP